MVLLVRAMTAVEAHRYSGHHDPAILTQLVLIMLPTIVHTLTYLDSSYAERGRSLYLSLSLPDP